MHPWWWPRWVRLSIAIAAILAILAMLHRPLLRGVAEFLIVDEPIGRTDFMVLLPGSLENKAAIDEAVRRYIAGEAHGIMFFDPPISRAVRCGAWPDRAVGLRRKLTERGVPESAIVVPPEPCRTSREAAHALQNWLQGRPDTRLIVVDRLLRGRYDRRIFESILGAPRIADVRFMAMRGGVDENNWWHSREGIQLIFQNYAMLAFDWFNGDSAQCRGAWTLEEFEQSLPRPVAN